MRMRRIKPRPGNSSGRSTSNLPAPHSPFGMARWNDSNLEVPLDRACCLVLSHEGI